jgi:hypothetical protein
MLQALRARWYLTAAVVLAAILAAAAVKLSSNSVPTGAATVQIVIDSPQSALADLKQDPAPLVIRAPVFAQLMTSNEVLRDIARAAGVRPQTLTAEGPYSGGGEPLNVPTPSEARSAQLLASNALYHFTFVADATIPMVTASVEGPNPAAAGKIANAVAPGVRTWLASLQSSVPLTHRVTIRELGDAQAGVVNAGSVSVFAGLAAVAVLIVGLLLIGALDRRKLLDPQLSAANVAEFAPIGATGLPHGVVKHARSNGGRGQPDGGRSSGDGHPVYGAPHSGDGPDRLEPVSEPRPHRGPPPADELADKPGQATEAR